MGLADNWEMCRDCGQAHEDPSECGPQGSIILEWMANPDPRVQAEVDKLVRRSERSMTLTGWMRRVPYVGSLVHVFWFSLLDGGVRETCKPRWGALTFSFLNDGMGATVWHTVRSITHDQDDPYTGIYTDGAPASLREAEERESYYKTVRRLAS